MTASRLILIISGLIAAAQALHLVPHQTSEESLRGALNAVTRKQRSLNANPQAYYEYRMDNGKLQRQQVAAAAQDDEQDDDNEDNLAFIPAEGVGQLETIGNGYQHLTNRQLEKALMDYLQFPADQKAPAKSIFRERELNGSKKRNGSNGVTSRLNGEDLVKLLLEQLDSSAPDGLGPSDDEEREYQRTTYKNDAQLLREVLDEQDRDEDEDPKQTATYPRFPPAERRNVNALRYPLFNGDFKNLMYKRYSVAKRSAKAANRKRQLTDPTVAEDLGALFGTQSSEPMNHTDDHDHDEHDHHRNHDKTSESPVIKSKSMKEAAGKAENKTKERTIEVKKKSVDWSQYFGIDRRKKKASYVGRPGSQDQDNEYLLQKYYEIMAENLSPNKDASEKRDELQRMGIKLRNMKNQLIEEATRISARSNTDDQEAKEQVLSKLATAYSLEKLRRALRELSDNAAAERAAQLNQNNLTANHPSEGKSDDKRFRSSIDELQAIEKEGNCPQVDIIERRCKATEALIGDYRQLLLAPCVMYHICNACEQDECLERFALEAERICQEEDAESTPWSRKHCVQTAMQLPRYPPPVSSAAICRLEGDEPCLAPFQTQHHRRYLYTAKR